MHWHSIVSPFNLSVVTPGGSNEATEGKRFSLECQVTHTNIVLLAGGVIYYSWTREQGNGSVEISRKRVYSFTPEAGDHGATYHCRATLNSTALLVLDGLLTIDVLGELEAFHAYIWHIVIAWLQHL